MVGKHGRMLNYRRPLPPTTKARRRMQRLISQERMEQVEIGHSLEWGGNRWVWKGAERQHRQGTDGREGPEAFFRKHLSFSAWNIHAYSLWLFYCMQRLLSAMQLPSHLSRAVRAIAHTTISTNSHLHPDSDAGSLNFHGASTKRHRNASHCRAPSCTVAKNIYSLLKAIVLSILLVTKCLPHPLWASPCVRWQVARGFCRHGQHSKFVGYVPAIKQNNWMYIIGNPRAKWRFSSWKSSVNGRFSHKSPLTTGMFNWLDPVEALQLPRCHRIGLDTCWRDVDDPLLQTYQRRTPFEPVPPGGASRVNLRWVV